MGWQYQQKPPLGWPLDYDSGLVPEVGFWLMNEGSGNIIQDLSGNGNKGTLIADTHFVPGKFGSALDFDGTGDYVDLGVRDFGIDNGFTFTAWIRCTSASGDDRMIVACDDVTGTDHRVFQFRIDQTTGNLRLIRFDAGENVVANFSYAGKDLADSMWHHVVATFSVSNGSALYIDGIAVATDADTTVNNNTDKENTFIGARDSTSPDGFFTGQIDNVMMWNRALTAGKVAWLYQYPFWMFKDPAEMILAAAGQVAVGTILPQITSAYMRVSS